MPSRAEDIGLAAWNFKSPFNLSTQQLAYSQNLLRASKRKTGDAQATRDEASSLTVHPATPALRPSALRRVLVSLTCSVRNEVSVDIGCVGPRVGPGLQSSPYIHVHVPVQSQLRSGGELLTHVSVPHLYRHLEFRGH